MQAESSSIYGMLTAGAFLVFSFCLSRLFARTRHGFFWIVLPYAPVIAIIVSIFANAFGAPILFGDDTGLFIVSATFLYWFALIILLSLKRWPPKPLAGMPEQVNE